MKEKAIKTLEAAQILVDSRKVSGYNSSIHCSYYAVFQYMKFMLAHTDKRPLPYDKQDNNDKDSHEFVLTEIKNRINGTNNSRNFAQCVRWLKHQRKDADYTSRDFTADECLDCKEKAEGAISKLKQYFGNL